MMKVTIPIPEGKWHGSASEHVWATRGPWKNTAILRSVPIHAYGVSFGDTVRYRRCNGRRIMTEVIARSGHSTLRAMISSDVDIEDGAVESLLARLFALGCLYEDDGEALIAIDVPPELDRAAVESLLSEGERGGVWDIECGYMP